MKRHVERQRGAILVMTVLFIVVLLGFAALALDLGRLYVLRTEMQNAADASAMAAAAELDGGENAIADAVLAAKNLLSHQGRFANSPELLANLEYDPDNPADSAFVFYSWIGAELDDDPISPHYICESQEDANKCRTTDSTAAHYVKVKLYPELIDDDAYQISLYFLPVLGLFLEDGTALTASTRVSAVAGAGGPVYCQYPPLFMCAYEEENPPEEDEEYDPDKHYPGIGIGEEVMLRPQSASSSWGPGNVGYLDVGEDITITLDSGDTRVEKNKSAMAAALGNEFIRRSCDPAIVSTLTGIDQNKTRKAFNTRFGLYDGSDGFDNAKNAFPPAPNTIDYPLDDIYSPASPSYDATARKGVGWNNTECLMPTSGCDAKSEVNKNPTKNLYTWPETFNRYDYILYNHRNGDPTNPDPSPPIGTGGMPDESRYALYQWELNSIFTPQLDGVPNIATPDQENCSAKDGGKKYCWLHSGNPVDGDPGTPGDPERRILHVAIIKCKKYEINGVTPYINLNPEVAGDPFPFHKFFLTKHAQDPSEAKIFAEYLGPVEKEEEINKIKHTIIQLYE